MEKPTIKPQNANFSSGPCSKRPGWSVDALSSALTGRSHRSKPGKERLKEAIELQREILGIPQDYLVGIVPGSDTGAFEMALWSMIGARDVDVLAWESFSKGWLADITKQLKVANVTEHVSTYGTLPDLSRVNCENDVVFVWNGTTSGVRVPNGDWIDGNRGGLTFCDATSAVFAYDMPWDKLDVTTWSWQKALGGEAAHGMLVLSPQAVERLESFVPDRPLPKLFRMTKGGVVNRAIFEGATINTPSMLVIEDCLDALEWVKSIGGLQATMKRSEDNFAVIKGWVSETPWATFLASDDDARSITSICIALDDAWFNALPDSDRAAFVKRMCALLDEEGVAHDIGGYRDAPPSIRIWGGATVESSDVEALMPWLEWAFAQCKTEFKEKAA